jgi:amino acid transporter
MEPSERHLVRGIGRWDLVGIFINGVVGAGIFALPAKLFGLLGSYSLHPAGRPDRPLLRRGQ